MDNLTSTAMCQKRSISFSTINSNDLIIHLLTLRKHQYKISNCAVQLHYSYTKILTLQYIYVICRLRVGPYGEKLRPRS